MSTMERSMTLFDIEKFYIHVIFEETVFVRKYCSGRDLNLQSPGHSTMDYH